MAKADEAKEILRMLGMPKGQQNDNAAYTLLAFTGLGPKMPWSKARAIRTNPHGVIEFASKKFNKVYRENTRESIRRQAIHQFVQGGICIEDGKAVVTTLDDLIDTDKPAGLDNIKLNIWYKRSYIKACETWIHVNKDGSVKFMKDKKGVPKQGSYEVNADFAGEGMQDVTGITLSKPSTNAKKQKNTFYYPKKQTKDKTGPVGLTLEDIAGSDVGSEPRDNGTREVCYWCGRKTEALMGTARFCRICKK